MKYKQKSPGRQEFGPLSRLPFPLRHPERKAHPAPNLPPSCEGCDPIGQHFKKKQQKKYQSVSIFYLNLHNYKIYTTFIL